MSTARDRRSGDRPRLVAALDIGSSKIGCLIAEQRVGSVSSGASGSPSLKVRAFTHQRSHGIKSGVVVDLPAAQRVVRAVVADAELIARAHLSSVYVAVNCGRPKSQTFAGHVVVTDGVVHHREVEALASGAETFACRDGRTLLVLDQIGLRLDGVPVAGVPLGLAGRRLDADHHAVTVDEGPLHNLSLLVRSCHLEIAGLVPAAYASALAATTEEERRLGVISIDIGAGVTSIAAFVDGHFLFTDLIPVGGQHLTLDIANGLGIPLAEAERIKALYGTLVASASDQHDLVAYRCTGGAEGLRNQTTKAVIGQIVRHRMQCLLQLVGQRVAAGSIGSIAIPRIVLSGGASRLLGLSGFVARELAVPGAARNGFDSGPSVRVASPAVLAGVVDEQSSPAFACLAGLQLAAARQAPSSRHGSSSSGSGQHGYIGRMERWLQESF